MAAPNEVDECAECAEEEQRCKCELFNSIAPDRNKNLIHQHGGKPNVSANFESLMAAFSGKLSAKPDHRALALAFYLANCPPLMTMRELKVTKKQVLDENGEVCDIEEYWSKAEDPDGCETITQGNDVLTLFQATEFLLGQAQAGGYVPPMPEGLRCPLLAPSGTEKSVWIGDPTTHPKWDTLTEDQQCAILNPKTVTDGIVEPFVLPTIDVPTYEWVERFIVFDGTIPDPESCLPGQIIITEQVPPVNEQNTGFAFCEFAICVKGPDGKNAWALSDCPPKGVPYNEADFPDGNPNGQPCGEGVNEGDFLIKFDAEDNKLGIVAVCLNGSWCVFPGWEALCVEEPTYVPFELDGEPAPCPFFVNANPVDYKGTSVNTYDALSALLTEEYGCSVVVQTATDENPCTACFPPECENVPDVIEITTPMELDELECDQRFVGEDPNTGEDVDFIGTGLTLQPGYNAVHADSSETKPRLSMQCTVPEGCNTVEFCFEINQTAGAELATQFVPAYSVGIVASATGAIPGDTPTAGTHIGVSPAGEAWFEGSGPQCVSYAVTPGGTFQFLVNIGNDPAQDQNTPNSLTNGTLECS